MILSDEAQRVVTLLTRRGPLGAADVLTHADLPKTSFQRALAGLGDTVLRVGRARATRYAARRTVPDAPAPIPVYELDRAGSMRRAFTLHPVEPFGFWVEGEVPEVPSGFFGTSWSAGRALDLPWFLQEIVPQGFLGRTWAQQHVALRFPADPERWTGDDALRYAHLYGADLPGAFVIGEFARDQVLHAPRTPALPAGDEARAFPELAEGLARTPWGSSAGGEQPKFTGSTIEADGRQWAWITKFSPPTDSPGGQRWADLLVAEHLAHGVLREAGFEAATSRILDAGGRRFLQVERFDRHGARGRSGACSLACLDRDDLARDLRRWTAATAGLAAEGVITDEDHARVQWLEAFGQRIANTDMHPGNLGFRLLGATILGLAPVYDMLPMFHAPRHGGELVRGLYEPALDPAPEGVREAARTLWERVIDDARVSDGFRPIARGQLARL